MTNIFLRELRRIGSAFQLAGGPVRNFDRRQFVSAALITAASGVAATEVRSKEDEPSEKEVGAVEDLMREHGVLRRALLVYTVASTRLRRGEAIPAEPLTQAARLFRQFGEDYHERMLEEKHVFPALSGASGSFVHLTDVLKAQHKRGREITAYLIEATRSGNVASADAKPLAEVMDGFVLMYRHHAAIEDTVVFPAWKAVVSDDDYHELSERFEDLERQMFGEDGYEDAVKRIAAVEEAFGIADLETSTAPAPPKRA